MKSISSTPVRALVLLAIFWLANAQNPSATESPEPESSSVDTTFVTSRTSGSMTSSSSMESSMTSSMDPSMTFSMDSSMTPSSTMSGASGTATSMPSEAASPLEYLDTGDFSIKVLSDGPLDMLDVNRCRMPEVPPPTRWDSATLVISEITGRAQDGAPWFFCVDLAADLNAGNCRPVACRNPPEGGPGAAVYLCNHTSEKLCLTYGYIEEIAKLIHQEVADLGCRPPGTGDLYKGQIWAKDRSFNVGLWAPPADECKCGDPGRGCLQF